jgi:hypothetical protein
MGPFQVTCVLAAAVFAAGFSISITLARQQPQTRYEHLQAASGQNTRDARFLSAAFGIDRSSVVEFSERRSEIDGIDDKITWIARLFAEGRNVE